MMQATEQAASAQAIEAFARLLGEENIVTDSAARAVFSRDIVEWDGSTVDLIVRPGDAEDVANCVRLAAEHGLAIAPRGGGLSYTGGYVPERAGTVLFDLGRLNDVHEVNLEDLYVTVGAACTWQHLSELLRPKRLRPEMTGPISGLYSTVGGAASQNVPGSMSGVLGVEVVLANGQVVRTGSAAITRSGSPFYRNYGPDLTGLFLGDTGAFGIKTAVTLRLEAVPEGVAFASFSFESLSQMVAAMTDVARLGVASKTLGMDPLKNRTATKVSLREGAETLREVARSRSSLVKGLKDAAKVVAAGRSSLDAVPWSLHLTVEGFDQQSADAAMATVKLGCAKAGGREIEPSIPIALRAKPYSVRGFLGMQGERWVPVHGIFPLSRAQDVVARVERFFAEHEERLAADDITYSFISSMNGPFWLLEPMFYWFDEVGAYHQRYLEPAKFSKYARAETNAKGRATVFAMRAALRDLFFELGAVTAQIGKYYDIAGALDPATYEVLTTIKDALDPDRRLNPGNLGWR